LINKTFDDRSSDYDRVDYRLRYTADMAESIRSNIKIDGEMEILDYGAGTGLLSMHFSKSVKKIIAVDTSSKMLEKFREKAESFGCETELLNIDLSRECCELSVDGIISSMTLHHIADLETLFANFYTVLKPGAFLAICDIDKENGSFHTVNSGVVHYGFDRSYMRQLFENAGFVSITIEDCCIIRKPQGDYSSFLAHAKKKDIADKSR